jgi:hypothetical protein
MMEVRLDQQEWNQLLQILAQAPWNVANPLIMKIGEQLRAQQQKDDPGERPARPNGAATDPQRPADGGGQP